MTVSVTSWSKNVAGVVTVKFSNGSLVDVPPGYTVIAEADLERLRGWASIVADLDRSHCGRHEGDAEAQTRGGVSLGNPLLCTEQDDGSGERLIGFGIGGSRDPIVMPPMGKRSDPANWRHRP